MCACAGAGWSAAHRLGESERLWKAWEALLGRLAVELRYTLRPMQEVLCALNTEEFRALAWLSEYRTPHARLHCPETVCAEEKTFANEFFAFLGTSDLDGQLTHIARFQQQAHEAARTAHERRTRLSGVYTAMGVCGGLCLGLLML